MATFEYRGYYLSPDVPKKLPGGRWSIHLAIHSIGEKDQGMEFEIPERFTDKSEAICAARQQGRSWVDEMLDIGKYPWLKKAASTI